ncbi:hypothetical protein OJF2_32240 [Aquisphaera giovannonii]|uniref:Glycosyltransferase RgtA/B/C/D-like domain-containing protein n=1 Tax=Aquisphaera giovannonii TaxID=406548 RepID=A0A5B9W283_9BACT|nr:hypothetical protein [Aquisphaera giovannonii]QEH34683.1 hypothetical protein OJF2_32240 [Aquisphaera giovannonii]
MALIARRDLRSDRGWSRILPGPSPSRHPGLLSPRTIETGPAQERERSAPPGRGPRDLRLCGAREGVEPGWDDGRVRRWVLVFLSLGVAMRLLRYALNFPLWNDEGYLALNILERDFAGLCRPLDYGQVCPLLFLWAVKAASLALGFSEWSLRLVPALASIASLFAFRHVAGRLLRGSSLALAVAVLAIGYTPVRYAGEVKPYATDLLAALGLIALAVEWLRRPERAGPLWGLAALGPVAIGISNPSIFVAASVGLVLAVPVLKTRSRHNLAALAVFGLASCATFLGLLAWINGPQGDHVKGWMGLYWANAFPPRSPGALLGWLVAAHTSHMFAYPAGGDHGSSTLTTCLVLAAVVAYLRRGPGRVLALLLAPFALGLAAAAMGRYPYGGSARTMQYVAPSIILMAGLGAAALLARLPRPSWRERSPRWALLAMLIGGLGQMAWDLAYPCKDVFFLESRALARRFWAEESEGAEVACARTDLRLPLDPLRWEADRAVMYLCHQAIYSPRHAAGIRPRLDRVGAKHPLRVVVFNETPTEAAAVPRWLRAAGGRFQLRARREHRLDLEFRRGRRVSGDRYVVYDLVPSEAGPRPAPGPGSPEVGTVATTDVSRGGETADRPIRGAGGDVEDD